VELMMAMVIFGFMATAVISGVIQVRKMSEDSVEQTVALTIVSGFLEQLVGTSYSRLLASVGDPSIGIPVRSANGAESQLFIGQAIEMEVPVHSRENPDSGEIVVESTMPLTIELQIDNLRAAGQDALAIAIVYSWESSLSGDTLESSVRIIRANVR